MKSGKHCLMLAAVMAASAGMNAQQQQPGVPAAPAANAQDWPRNYTRDGATLMLYQPQVDTWKDQLKLGARLAIAVIPAGSKEPVFGAARVEADTQTHIENRTVYIYNVKLETLKIPGKDPATSQQMEALAHSLFPEIKPLTIGLDRVLASLKLGEFNAREVKVSLEPPPIFYSTMPARLLITDGKPVLVDIEKTQLQYVINTNWDLFFDKSAPRYYLLDKDTWLSAASANGDWVATGKLPPAFNDLPAGGNWDDARKLVPAQIKQGYVTPRIFVSEKPAELILAKGTPQFKPIAGTNLSYLTNSESDVFFDATDKKFYFLTSGRWFRTSSPQGPWESATESLPADFAKIPVDHPRSSVLASVKGTPQAQEAVLLATIPQTATLSRTEAKAESNYAGGKPEWTPIPGTNVSYAKNTQGDIFKVGELYYMCEKGAWFSSTSPDGPWALTADVPKDIYQIPSDSPKNNVTYVNVYNSTPTTITYGYTAGYMGMYVAYGCLMYGTGFYYPPYWGYGYYHYPIYYPPHYYAYGMGAWYNPYTGGYGRRAVAYGPYGGYGRSAYYNPRTGTYARGASAWGPGGSAWGAAAVNPRTGQWGTTRGGYNAYTGNYAAGYQRGNAYSSWGQGVVGHGDDWAHGGYYSNERGTVAGAQTSEGGKIAGVSTDRGSTAVAKDKNNNVYAGHDGNVYKKDAGGGWSTYNNGSWNQVSQDQVNQAKSQAQQRSGSAASSASGRTQPGSDVMQGLNRDSQSRYQGSQREMQQQSYRQSGGAGNWGGRSYGGGGGYGGGGMRGGGGGFRRR